MKAVNKSLEVFVNWGEPTASEPNKEKEDDMSNFSAQIHKQTMGAKGEITLSSEVPGKKRPRRFGLEEEP